MTPIQKLSKNTIYFLIKQIIEITSFKNNDNSFYEVKLYYM